MSKFLKGIFIFFSAIILLICLVIFLIYLPIVQNKAIEYGIGYAKNKLGLNISIEEFALHFPLDITVDELTVKDSADISLFTLGQLSTEVKFLPLLKGNIKSDSISIRKIVADTRDLIEGISFKGYLNEFSIINPEVNLRTSYVDVPIINLNNTDVYMSFLQSSKKDTTPSNPVDWSFKIDKLNVNNIKYTLDMPQDTMYLSTYIDDLNLSYGYINLLNSQYTADTLMLKNGSYMMHMGEKKDIKGFNPNNFSFNDINIDVSNFYMKELDFKAEINDLRVKEGNNIDIRHFSTFFEYNPGIINVRKLDLKTSVSNIKADAMLDLNMLKDSAQLDSYADLKASIGAKDLEYFLEAYVPDVNKIINNNTLIVNAGLKGKKNHLFINNTNISLGNLAEIDIKGDVLPAKELKDLKCALTINSTIKPDQSLAGFIPVKNISLPSELILNSDIKLNNNIINTTTELAYGISNLNVEGQYNMSRYGYDAQIKAKDLNIKTFLRSLDIPALSFDIKAEGEGFDFMSPACYMNVGLDLSKFVFGDLVLDHMKLNALLKKSNYNLNVSINDTLGNINLNTSGILNKKEIKGDLSFDVSSLDLMLLGVSKEKTILSFDSKIDYYTDLKNRYKAVIGFDSISFDMDKRVQKIRDIDIDFLSNRDSTYLEVNNGDLNVMAMMEGSIEGITATSAKLASVLDKMIAKKDIEIIKIKEALPELFLQITSGNNNLLNGILKSAGINYSSFNAIMVNEDDRPMMLSFEMPDFKSSSLILNDTYLSFNMDSTINFDVVTNKGGKEKIEQMDIKVIGEMTDNNLTLNLKQKDGNGNVGFDFGIDAALKGDTLSLSFDTINTTILYTPWIINAGNYIDYSFDNRIKADLQMKAPGGMSIYINSNDTSSIPGKISLYAGIKNFNVEKFLEPFSDVPRFKGMVNVDVYGEALKDSLRAELNVDINDFVYDKKSLKPINLNGTFYSAPGLGYNIDSKILYDEKQISMLEASIKESDELSAYLQLLEFPADIANPFIPQDMASLAGFLNGNIKASGKLNAPIINGEIFFDNTIVNIGYANADFQLGSNKIVFENSIVKFDNFKVLAYNKNPLLINGTFDMRDFSNMSSNLRVTGSNVELINVKKQRNKMLYGKLFMDINTQVRGPLDLLKVTGNVSLLGGSDFTYVLLDSPLSAQNRVGNLVEFTNFNDTIQQKSDTKINSLMSGVDIALTLSIAPSVQVGIDLAANGSDRVELIGGGDLAFLMTPQGDMEMNGRYELSGGFVRYNLPVLPVSKTFDIVSGSYVEWKGSLLDPYINITAAEKIRTTVTEEDKGSRVVNFDAMIKIFNTLNNLDIAFDLSAPDDIAIQNQLASMTSEERGKQAISLIVTKMYTGPGTTAKLNSNNALTAFIQKEINQFAGDNLKGVDISFGIDSYDQYGTGGESGTRTDYSFRFSKKFFNDRFKIVVGGTVSSGQDPAQQDNQSFINDIILEYTLDKSGTRYLKLFHHTNNESLLEGEIIETGLGIVLKRKVRKLRQLFIFNEEKRRRRIEQDPELMKK